MHVIGTDVASSAFVQKADAIVWSLLSLDLLLNQYCMVHGARVQPRETQTHQSRRFCFRDVGDDEVDEPKVDFLEQDGRSKLSTKSTPTWVTLQYDRCFNGPRIFSQAC